jgi:hypothetical protein
MAVSRETKKRMSRWLHAFNQRLLGIIFILFFTFFFIGPVFFPSAYWIFTLVVLGLLVSNGLRIATGLVITSFQVRRYVRIDWTEKCREHDVAAKAKAAAKSLEQADSEEAQKESDSATTDMVIVDASVATTPEMDQAAIAASIVDKTVLKAKTEQEERQPLQLDQVRHLIIIPNYKEDLETLHETLDTLANHQTAKSMYKVVLAMEEGEKESDKKAGGLISKYESQFFAMHYTVHPSGIRGEARGKSSNVAWAASYYAKMWLKPEENGNELITVMDADTHLSENYFECITYKYLMAKYEERTRLIFAPTLIFDRNANDVPFVVRLTDMAWSTGLLGNFQMPVKFPCSVYTVTMLLAQRVGFWDAGPEAIGEDMHMSLKCLTATHMKLKITPIYIPASCSNVQGDTAWQSIVARFEQSKRHLWGSLDFGYVCSRLITHNCWLYNPFKSLLCVYLLFEIFFQPYFGFYQLSGQLIFPASTANPFAVYSLGYGSYVRLALLLPAIVIGVTYEFYHHEACTFRAGILKKAADRKAAEATVKQAEEGTVSNSEDNMVATPAYTQSAVAFRKWYQILDWLGLPFCLVFYYIIPGVNAMLGQMFTNKLDYKVSLKPTTRQGLPAAGASDAEAASASNVELEEMDVRTAVEEGEVHAREKTHMSLDSDMEMDMHDVPLKSGASNDNEQATTAQV